MVLDRRAHYICEIAIWPCLASSERRLTRSVSSQTPRTTKTIPTSHPNRADAPTPRRLGSPAPHGRKGGGGFQPRRAPRRFQPVCSLAGGRQRPCSSEQLALLSQQRDDFIVLLRQPRQNRPDELRPPRRPVSFRVSLWTDALFWQKILCHAGCPRCAPGAGAAAGGGGRWRGGERRFRQLGL